MARLTQTAEHLAAIPMFAACDKHELRAISRLATEIEVNAGKELTTEGGPGHEFMIILEGTATATKDGRPVAQLGPGDYFGEIALLDPGVRTATVVADTDMTVAVVGDREFTQVLDEAPAVARKIMQGLARRLREVDASVKVE
jgi:CRP-like cAMP-binding protein